MCPTDASLTSAAADAVPRRTLLAGAVALAAGTSAAGCGRGPSDGTAAQPERRPRRRPVALVYRGPAACDGCAETVGALLSSGSAPFDVRYCGPDERLPLTAESLSGAAVYAQPGGGNDVDRAWAHLRGAAPAVRDHVRAGGRYLGFCMGGYLAGSDPGFALLPGDADQYTASPRATVRTADDTVVRVRWRRRTRHLYFQDGPLFTLRDGADAEVLATYDNGPAAAVVAAFGKGRVGVTGPHPEAGPSWYDDAGLTNPDGVRLDLARDLVATTMR